MQSSKKATKAQTDWHNWLRDQGCVICKKPAEIHHCAGSTAKHNKIHIGHWWCIPLCTEHHRGKFGIHGANLDLFKLKYRASRRKEIEKGAFVGLAMRYGEVPEQVCYAISDYRR